LPSASQIRSHLARRIFRGALMSFHTYLPIYFANEAYRKKLRSR
jgi:hypothetical protein